MMKQLSEKYLQKKHPTPLRPERIQKKVPVKIIPFIIVVEENAHQIPFRPIEVFPRIIASGILALVKRMLMMLHRFVLPSPDMAPMVVSSMHRKASLNPMITR